jgi:hypothetical protein
VISQLVPLPVAPRDHLARGRRLPSIEAAAEEAHTKLLGAAELVERPLRDAASRTSSGAYQPSNLHTY